MVTLFCLRVRLFVLPRNLPQITLPDSHMSNAVFRDRAVSNQNQRAFEIYSTTDLKI